ncbi:MAG: hypothetical protein CLLPBCKN_003076 [Chroococcidiopsis cubana SAG 39.79]|jgi:hypothetical protein|uniref:GUN4 domain protein n=2 Tax=Chroococcidiopsis TaxID=54298 RepID=K9TV42_CHRTP|nr:GUN4 domain-containing protein [Chroococcidiopsis cubana]AFY86425.1 GUN4 domain protein [Chroococcidiopsis thermalis PCC 7203]MDZ4873680.1 hypothetical protein [Chroococcidiopsis cubana SAG 39.79]PSB41325.1 GUN4 domain-containing protein [Cyanosarcina cf. burmensis CCALA 770]RUT03713.1 hypothetical protein DSM107010_59960 [Chroococcidiopsis cubana SAG 39.79]
MSSEIKESEAIARLAMIETQLGQMTQMLSNLSDRLARTEDNFLLVADVYRYKKLQELLAAENFHAADWETIRLIQSVTGELELESITPEQIRSFPCNELQVIDNLWRKYSNGRFGFSIQTQIYQSIGGSIETTINQDYQIIESFGDRVGWRSNRKWLKCDDLDYTLTAPIGCHPSRWWNSPFGAKMTNYFFNRLITCQL